AYDKGTSTPSTAPVEAPKAAPTPTSPSGGEVDGRAGEGASGGRVFASPLARRLAREAGIDVSAISGTGPKGRVVKADVEAARSGKAPLKAAASAPAAAPAGAAPTGMTKAQVLALY